MQRLFRSVRKTVGAATALVLAISLFSACTKDSGNGTAIPASGLMAFNLTSDQPAVGITLSGNTLTNSPLAYTSYTGGYLNVYAGGRSVKSYNYLGDSALASSDFNFETNKYYSLFVVGNKGVYSNVVVNDDIDSLSSASGGAFVRYINAIPDSSAPEIKIAANGNNIVDSTVKFASASGFKPVTAGEVAITLTNGSTISASRTITLEDRNIYTVLLVGDPSSTDTAKSVQIKYIPNGTLDK